MKEITPREVQQLLADKQPINLIDVRETDEVESGKIPGITHIPLGLLEFKLQDLDKAKQYIMVCRSGGRSGRAVKLLEDHGFQVTNMVGGMKGWDGEVE